MTRSILIGSRRINPATALLVLAAVAIGAALLTPDAQSGGGLSSYSAGPGGTRMMYELAQRMGWRTSRREAILDSFPQSPNTQVVIGPQGSIGAHEVHMLLENVRRGGGLIFAVDGAPEISDSLGIVLKSNERLLGSIADVDCPRMTTMGARQTRSLPPMVDEVGWSRPPPGMVVPLATTGGRRPPIDIAVGFPLGRGRVAAVSAADVFANGAVRVCEWGADLAVARSLEYVAAGGDAPSLVFDEYHHGYGMHGGSLRAISMFLSRTASGHFLAQALIAAFILLLAAAPRPIMPRDPERIVRRSPLEHADALGRAYADVQATRTATSRLVGGLRRRAGRTVSIAARASDAEFLDAVARRTPSLAPRVDSVKRALDRGLPSRELPAVGDSIAEIERVLLTSPPTSR